MVPTRRLHPQTAIDLLMEHDIITHWQVQTTSQGLWHGTADLPVGAGAPRKWLEAQFDPQHNTDSHRSMNKCIIELLRQLATRDEKALACYNNVKGRQMYMFGKKYLSESQQVECKGGKTATQVMTLDELKDHFFKDKQKALRCIAGMLNAEIA